MTGVASARKQGYAITRDIATIGVVSVGAVLPTHQERSPFAVSISFPRSQETPEHIEFTQKMLRQELEAFTGNFRWPS